jgi:hypothetical protein
MIDRCALAVNPTGTRGAALPVSNAGPEYACKIAPRRDYNTPLGPPSPWPSQSPRCDGHFCPKNRSGRYKAGMAKPVETVGLNYGALRKECLEAVRRWPGWRHSDHSRQHAGRVHGLGDVVREGRRKDRRSRDRLCAARKATAFLPDRMIELYLSWSVARLPVRDGKATYAAQKLMMEPSFQSQALWQRCASFSFLMVEGCIKHYQGFQIEPFEAGRGLWHARLRRIDRKPMTIDGISLPTLEVGFAWPDSDAATQLFESTR